MSSLRRRGAASGLGAVSASPAAAASRKRRTAVFSADFTDLLRSCAASFCLLRLIWDLMFATGQASVSSRRVGWCGRQCRERNERRTCDLERYQRRQPPQIGDQPRRRASHAQAASAVPRWGARAGTARTVGGTGRKPRRDHEAAQRREPRVDVRRPAPRAVRRRARPAPRPRRARRRGRRPAGGRCPARRVRGPASSSRRASARPVGVEDEVVVTGVGVHEVLASGTLGVRARQGRGLLAGAASPAGSSATLVPAGEQGRHLVGQRREVQPAGGSGSSRRATDVERVEARVELVGPPGAAWVGRRRGVLDTRAPPSGRPRGTSSRRGAGRPSGAGPGACAPPRRTTPRTARCALRLAALTKMPAAVLAPVRRGDSPGVKPELPATRASTTGDPSRARRDHGRRAAGAATRAGGRCARGAPARRHRVREDHGHAGIAPTSSSVRPTGSAHGRMTCPRPRGSSRKSLSHHPCPNPKTRASRPPPRSPAAPIPRSSGTSASSRTSTTASRRWPTGCCSSPAWSTRRSMRAQYLDRMDIERERGITIKSQAVRMPWTCVEAGEDTGRNVRAQHDRHPGARRLHLRGVAVPRGVRGRGAARRRGAGHRGADAGEPLPRARRRPAHHPGAQQDRPARRGAGEVRRGAGRDHRLRPLRGAAGRRPRPARASPSCSTRSSRQTPAAGRRRRRTARGR